MQSALLGSSGNSMCLDISGWDTASDGKPAQLWGCNQTGAQQFTYTPHQQTLRLKSDPSYCLDVSGSNASNGTAIQLWRCNGTAAQQFEYHLGDKTLRTLLNPNYCVDVSGSNNSNGTRIQLYGCNGTAAQRFSMNIAAGSPAPLVELKSALQQSESKPTCLDVNGTHLRLWECNLTGAQQFEYEPAYGHIKLKSVPNSCLEVIDSNTADNTIIHLATTCNDRSAQRFEYITGDRTFRSLLDTRKCISIQNGNVNGSSIVLHTCIVSAAQQFSME